MTKEELKEIEERCNAATRGPWEIEDGNSVHPEWIVQSELVESWYKEDLAFVLASRTDIPKLLAYVQELEQLNEKLELAYAAARQSHPDFWKSVDDAVKHIKETWPEWKQKGAVIVEGRGEDDD